MKNVKLLDCTLRDGGYYNNWNFSIPEANRYLKQIYASNIDIVEIGFKFLKENKNYGHFAFINKKLLKKIPHSKKTKFAIMLNAEFYK